MEIRAMTIDDNDAVQALWTGTPGMSLNPYDDSRNNIARYLERNPKTCFVAEEKESIAGVVLSGHDGRRGYLYHMAVAKEKRGRGIGGALLDKALAALGNEGIQKVSLFVLSSNDDGNKFWENRGFAERNDVVFRSRILSLD